VIIDSTVEPVLPMLRAVGKIPSGLFILTTGDGPEFSAMLVSFVQQLSFEPLCIGVAVHRGRAIGDVIEKSGFFTLNICSAGDKGLLRKYARQALTGDAALAGVAHHKLPEGAIVFPEACAYVHCRFSHRVSFHADHELFIGVVEAGDMPPDQGAKPMVHTRHDGSKY
jgi:flavin reductase (DIM6/NTAB) family NADH-FMN oxidoreductase RutF